MSFDRLLPEKIAFVDKRFHSPLVGIWIHAIMAIFLMLLIEYWLVFKGLTAAVIFAPVVGFIVTMISAVVFPYVKKTRAIYETAPASKFKVAGIPLISIVGIIGLLYTVLIAYFWIAIPELGYFNYRSIAVVAGLYVASAIWYFAWRAYQRSKGVNIDLLFTEIPPA